MGWTVAVLRVSDASREVASEIIWMNRYVS